MDTLQSDVLQVPEKKYDGIITPKVYLFVCSGNTCRSPMCEAVFNDKYANESRFAISAGLYGDGSPISANAIAALEEFGIKSRPGNDYANHISTTLNESMIKSADYIYGVTSSHAFSMIIKFPEYASKISSLPTEISDPFGGDVEDYKKCLEDIIASFDMMFGEKK